MVEREQIISFLKSKGPCVPNDMKRALGGDTMIFGAMLSELSARGSVLITKVKKGSSPFYYVPGQEKQLEKLIEFCNPKDQKTIELLKEKQILRDQSLELFARVSLRQVPDFAKEMPVQTAEGKILFWRYYLLSEDEAIARLKATYNKAQSSEATSASKQKVSHVPEKKPVKVAEQPKPVVQEVAKEVPVKLRSTIVQNSELNKVDTLVKTNTETSSLPLKAKIITSEKEFVAQPRVTPQAYENTQQHLSQLKPVDKAEFHIEVLHYFKNANITLISQEQIGKNREYEFIVRVPSAVGDMEMYCRARNKKKLTEGDVAPALLKAKQKDLPCIFLSNGEFSKKSLLIIEKEYKGLVIKTL